MSKTITKSELAAVMSISPTTLRKYLHKTHYNTLVELGYERHSHLLNGKVLEFLMDRYCLSEADFE